MSLLQSVLILLLLPFWYALNFQEYQFTVDLPNPVLITHFHLHFYFQQITPFFPSTPWFLLMDIIKYTTNLTFLW